MTITIELEPDLEQQDAWIAATALRHTIPLVTHNPSDFQYITNLELRTTIK